MNLMEKAVTMTVRSTCGLSGGQGLPGFLCGYDCTNRHERWMEKKIAQWNIIFSWHFRAAEKVSKSALDIHGLGVCSSVIYAALHRPCL